MENLRRALETIARYLPVVAENQEAALWRHLELLLRWNTRVNLTAVRDFEEAARKHLGESLFLAARLPDQSFSACDLGSGGGFPGIPAAILHPDCRITLVERDGRKSVFLREASRELPNVQVINRSYKELDGEFDWLLSRAVNLSLIKGGPVPRWAAFLGGESSVSGAGLAARYRWERTAIPWNNSGFLWLGEASGNVSRETLL